MTALLPLRVPKIMSYQREISPRTVCWGHALSRGTLHFTAVSHRMMRSVQEIGRWTMIPNGVPLDRYSFRAESSADAPLVFLGRIEEIKGPHLAIEIAKRVGRQLIIAGNIPDEKRSWAEEFVLPHVDDQLIRYIGPVNDAQKNVLLGTAAALLMPILWDEPFGIVMIEAMACGTPVIGLARGAVPEIILDGVTGFVCEDTHRLVAAVGRLPDIVRAACRRRVEEFYSEAAVVDAYLALYRELVAASRKW